MIRACIDRSTGMGAGLPTVRGASGVKRGHVTRCLSELRPTFSHMALVGLMDAGYLDFVCTQNIENLHRLSGIREVTLL